jgi:hypothetical protein
MDTVNSNPQMKIFTGNYSMYARYANSKAAFGVREVVAVRGGIEERNIFGISDTSLFVIPNAFHVEIEKTETGFKSVIPSIQIMGQDLYIEETYRQVSGGKKASVDGAWQLTKAFTVNGTDTTHLDIVQFKFYQSGHFIFGHALRDSAGVQRAGMGFGTFEMTGEDALVENVEVSSYPAIVGKSFNIKVTLTAPNQLLEIVDELEGVKSVEYYQRMVKGMPGGVENWQAVNVFTC